MAENDNSSGTNVENSVMLDYIKIQWADIRHSRLQEWSALGVVGGVMYALVNLETTSVQPKILLGLLGLLGAIIGASMSWQHYHIFRTRIGVITDHENEIGLKPYPIVRKDVVFPVQMLIFLLFGGIASAFAGITTYFVSEIPSFGALRGFSPLVAISGFAIFFAWTYRRRTRSISAWHKRRHEETEG